jgi:hypothetical protein
MDIRGVVDTIQRYRKDLEIRINSEGTLGEIFRQGLYAGCIVSEPTGLKVKDVNHRTLKCQTTTDLLNALEVL